MEEEHATEQHRAERRKSSGGSEKVLIEREGRFELMNASDMEANLGSTAEPHAARGGRDGKEGGGGREGGKDDTASGLSPSQTQTEPPLNGPEAIETPSPSELPQGNRPAGQTSTRSLTSQTSRDETGHVQSDNPTRRSSSDHPAVSSFSSSSSNSTGQIAPQGTSSDAGDAGAVEASPTQATAKTIETSAIGGHTGSRTSSKSSVLQSGSRVQIVAADHIQPKKNLSSASTAYLSRSKRKGKGSEQVSRAVSAPGMRSRGKTEDEEAREKRERSEAAFTAWVAAKNQELLERRKSARERQQLSKEEMELKRQRNEAAYQGWLASKVKQLKSQEKPPQVTSTVSEEDRKAAFENWVSRKERERRSEQVLEESKRAEEEEAAGKVAPGIVEQAYRKWLHQKNRQAREEAKRKEQYRRSYFSQSKSLRQSLSLRFEGF